MFALPHKFKIAVGGCPNNCVKPNLNDVGIIGQRIPEVNSELCKGCKKCAIEAACPNGVAKVVDGKSQLTRCSADIVVAVSENVRSIQLQMVIYWI